MPRNLKKGGGGGATLSHARRAGYIFIAQKKDSSLKVITFVSEKKRLSRPLMSNFSPQVKRRAKKSFHALKLSFIRKSLLHRESFVHLFAGGRGGGSSGLFLDMPLLYYLIVVEYFSFLLHNIEILTSDGVTYSTSEYEYRKTLRVRVQVLILKNVLKYEYRKKVGV